MSSELKLEINLKATLQNIDIFCKNTEKLLRENNLTEYVFSIQMLLREALTNAVVHGCKMNSELIIKSYFKLNKNELIMRIEDPGDGFDWKAARCNNCSVSADSGRGLSILDKYSSEYAYNKVGNKILIKKKIIRKE